MTENRQPREALLRDLPEPPNEAVSDLMAAILTQEHLMTPEAYRNTMHLATTEITNTFLDTASVAERLAVPMQLLRERAARLRNQELDSATQNAMTAGKLGAGQWVTERFREITGPHTLVTLMNPFLVCVKCERLVSRWHNPELCDCSSMQWWNEDCGHVAALTSYCWSWHLERTCQCLEWGHRDTPHVPGVWTRVEQNEASDAAMLATRS